MLDRVPESHGMWNTSEYHAWENMKARCLNPKHPSFVNYGGRGITICDMWRDSFINFYEDMGAKPYAEYTLERVNNDKGYSPDNCIWADRTSQILNRRQRKSKLGLKHIYQKGETQGYYVQICRNYTKVNYGTYPTIDEAIDVRDRVLMTLEGG